MGNARRLLSLLVCLALAWNACTEADIKCDEQSEATLLHFEACPAHLGPLLNCPFREVPIKRASTSVLLGSSLGSLTRRAKLDMPGTSARQARMQKRGAARAGRMRIGESTTTRAGLPSFDGCQVTVFENPDFSGWSATFSDGEYNQTSFEAGGARSNQVSSLRVLGEGCSAQLYKDANFGPGWGGIFAQGEYTSSEFEKHFAVVNEAKALKVFQTGAPIVYRNKQCGKASHVDHGRMMLKQCATVIASDANCDGLFMWSPTGCSCCALASGGLTAQGWNIYGRLKKRASLAPTATPTKQRAQDPATTLVEEDLEAEIVRLKEQAAGRSLKPNPDNEKFSALVKTQQKIIAALHISIRKKKKLFANLENVQKKHAAELKDAQSKLSGTKKSSAELVKRDQVDKERYFQLEASKARSDKELERLENELSSEQDKHNAIVASMKQTQSVIIAELQGAWAHNRRAEAKKMQEVAAYKDLAEREAQLTSELNAHKAKHTTEFKELESVQQRLQVRIKHLAQEAKKWKTKHDELDKVRLQTIEAMKIQEANFEHERKKHKAFFKHLLRSDFKSRKYLKERTAQLKAARLKSQLENKAVKVVFKRLKMVEKENSELQQQRTELNQKLKARDAKESVHKAEAERMREAEKLEAQTRVSSEKVRHLERDLKEARANITALQEQISSTTSNGNEAEQKYQAKAKAIEKQAEVREKQHAENAQKEREKLREQAAQREIKRERKSKLMEEQMKAEELKQKRVLQEMAAKAKRDKERLQNKVKAKSMCTCEKSWRPGGDGKGYQFVNNTHYKSWKCVRAADWETKGLGDSQNYRPVIKYKDWKDYGLNSTSTCRTETERGFAFCSIGEGKTVEGSNILYYCGCPVAYRQVSKATSEDCSPGELSIVNKVEAEWDAKANKAIQPDVRAWLSVCTQLTSKKGDVEMRTSLVAKHPQEPPPSWGNKILSRVKFCGPDGTCTDEAQKSSLSTDSALFRSVATVEVCNRPPFLYNESLRGFWFSSRISMGILLSDGEMELPEPAKTLFVGHNYSQIPIPIGCGCPHDFLKIDYNVGLVSCPEDKWGQCVPQFQTFSDYEAENLLTQRLKWIKDLPANMQEYCWHQKQLEQKAQGLELKLLTLKTDLKSAVKQERASKSRVLQEQRHRLQIEAEAERQKAEAQEKDKKLEEARQAVVARAEAARVARERFEKKAQESSGNLAEVVSHLRAKLEDTEDRLMGTEQALNISKSSLAQLEVKHDSLRKEQERVETELTKNSVEKGELHKQLLRLESEKNEVQSSGSNAQKELQNKLTTMESKLTNMESKHANVNKDLLRRVEAHQAETKAHQLRIERLQKTVDRITAESRAKEAASAESLAKLKTEIDQHKQRQSLYEAENSKLKKAAEEEKKRLELLEKQNTQLRNQNEQLQVKFDAMRTDAPTNQPTKAPTRRQLSCRAELGAQPGCRGRSCRTLLIETLPSPKFAAKDLTKINGAKINSGCVAILYPEQQFGGSAMVISAGSFGNAELQKLCPTDTCIIQSARVTHAGQSPVTLSKGHTCQSKGKEIGAVTLSHCAGAVSVDPSCSSKIFMFNPGNWQASPCQCCEGPTAGAADAMWNIYAIAT